MIPICMSMLACFYASMLLLASLVLGFATFDALGGFVVVWLHPTPIRHCLDVTLGMRRHDADSLRALPFSAPCNDMLTMLICATRWLYMHLYTLVYMSMHESCLLVCHPCFNTMKLWTFNPNLHFVRTYMI